MTFSEVLEKLSSLKVDRSSGHPKPHKVSLLLAVMDLIEQGKIANNRIVLNDELEAQFHLHMNKLKKGNDSLDIDKPFYHLKSDGFWFFTFTPDGEALLANTNGTPSKAKLKKAVEYVSLDEDIYKAFRSADTRPACKEALYENLDDLSEQFERWLLQTGKKEKTAKNYLQAIRGSITNWVNENNISQKNLIGLTGYSSFHSIAEEIASYDAFKEFDRRGKGMYSAALNHYRDFLADTGQVYINEDIDDILADKKIPNTEKAQMVKTRIGQGMFREKLINYWQGCALTGYKSTQFLVASHIKPWRAADHQERVSVFNGILLLPNLDKAFDLGYISFEENGQLLQSPQLERPEALGISKDMQIVFAKEHQDYLAYHRENLLKH